MRVLNKDDAKLHKTPTRAAAKSGAEPLPDVIGARHRPNVP